VTEAKMIKEKANPLSFSNPLNEIARPRKKATRNGPEVAMPFVKYMIKAKAKNTKLAPKAIL